LSEERRAKSALDSQIQSHNLPIAPHSLESSVKIAAGNISRSVGPAGQNEVQWTEEQTAGWSRLPCAITNGLLIGGPAPSPVAHSLLPKSTPGPKLHQPVGKRQLPHWPCPISALLTRFLGSRPFPSFFLLLASFSSFRLLFSFFSFHSSLLPTLSHRLSHLSLTLSLSLALASLPTISDAHTPSISLLPLIPNLNSSLSSVTPLHCLASQTHPVPVLSRTILLL